MSRIVLRPNNTSIGRVGRETTIALADSTRRCRARLAIRLSISAKCTRLSLSRLRGSAPQVLDQIGQTSVGGLDPRELFGICERAGQISGIAGERDECLQRVAIIRMVCKILRARSRLRFRVQLNSTRPRTRRRIACVRVGLCRAAQQIERLIRSFEPYQGQPQRMQRTCIRGATAIAVRSTASPSASRPRRR